MTSVRNLPVCLSILLVGFLVHSEPAFAQGLATLRGTVTDPSGAVIPSVTVTLTQVGTGFSRTVTADNQGAYLIPALHPADYVLTAQANGFGQIRRKGITLLADQSVTLN